MRVLVIDDEISIIKMLTEMLRSSHTVEGITSPESAIEILKHKKYDLIFLDYDMPEHDGKWFMTNVKLPETTIVLLFTGNLNRTMVFEMFKLGISGYLTKPISFEEVQKNLEFYSHSGQYASYGKTA